MSTKSKSTDEFKDFLALINKSTERARECNELLNQHMLAKDYQSALSVTVEIASIEKEIEQKYSVLRRGLKIQADIIDQQLEDAQSIHNECTHSRELINEDIKTSSYRSRVSAFVLISSLTMLYFVAELFSGFGGYTKPILMLAATGVISPFYLFELKRLKRLNNLLNESNKQLEKAEGLIADLKANRKLWTERLSAGELLIEESRSAFDYAKIKEMISSMMGAD